MMRADSVVVNSSEDFTRRWTEAQPMVSAYLCTCVPDFHSAEDLLQNVAVTLMRKFDDYDPARPFIAWAIGIAKFEVLRHRRFQARSVLEFRPDLAEELAGEFVDMVPELELRAHALRRCTEQLQGRSGEIMRLRYAEELKPRQIAEVLGLSSVVVRVALSRTRDFLRKCIERRLKSGAVI
jgi:RNA polymerase sigma-70 factor (ECF subfamily)